MPNTTISAQSINEAKWPIPSYPNFIKIKVKYSSNSNKMIWQLINSETTNPKGKTFTTPLYSKSKYGLYPTPQAPSTWAKSKMTSETVSAHSSTSMAVNITDTGLITK